MSWGKCPQEFFLGSGAAAPERDAAAAERAEPSASVGEATTSSDGRFSVGIRAGVGAWWAHEVAPGTDLVVRARAVTMVCLCGAWRVL